MPTPRFLSALSLVLVLLATGCEPAEEVPPADDMPATQPADANFLTPAEEEAGWQLLFDGSTTNGWHTYGQDTVLSGWSVDDGALHFAPGGEGGDLVTAATYGDFELSMDWKIAACGNSGVFYRARETDDEIYWNAVEMQVLDNTCHSDAATVSHQAGAVYDLYEPSADVTLDAGEWNHARVVARGPHIEHWLNGTKVAEYDTSSDDWKAKIAASKFATLEGYGMNPSGIIGLQDHGNEVWFRNIKIRPLS